MEPGAGHMGPLRTEQKGKKYKVDIEDILPKRESRAGGMARGVKGVVAKAEGLSSPEPLTVEGKN